ncbi:hypothetical protein D051_0840 [Vibrio parahaemolyticus VPCR-2010]|uniref:hypothetical protein n=1 Tax=Vibrio parahaemolyticus TaxID=670 RepID=UPI00038E585B|nr:hypothetical protein D051_0840 [Vibrio parahaemolyticus VPCR-2010]
MICKGFKNILSFMKGEVTQKTELAISADNVFIGDKYSQMELVAINSVQASQNAAFIVSPQYTYEIRNHAIPKNVSVIEIDADLEKSHSNYVQAIESAVSELLKLKEVPDVIIVENCQVDLRKQFGEAMDDITLLYIYHSGSEMTSEKHSKSSGIVHLFHHEDPAYMLSHLYELTNTHSYVKSSAFLKQQEFVIVHIS